MDKIFKIVLFVIIVVVAITVFDSIGDGIPITEGFKRSFSNLFGGGSRSAKSTDKTRQEVIIVCPDCKGTGEDSRAARFRMFDTECTTCRGEGVLVR
jgi:DnaJ-class molecular chaperone